jgi:hypothetical protein
MEDVLDPSYRVRLPNFYGWIDSVVLIRIHEMQIGAKITTGAFQMSLAMSLTLFSKHYDVNIEFHIEFKQIIKSLGDWIKDLMSGGADKTTASMGGEPGDAFAADHRSLLGSSSDSQTKWLTEDGVAGMAGGRDMELSRHLREETCRHGNLEAAVAAALHMSHASDAKGATISTLGSGSSFSAAAALSSPDAEDLAAHVAGALNIESSGLREIMVATKRTTAPALGSAVGGSLDACDAATAKATRGSSCQAAAAVAAVSCAVYRHKLGGSPESAEACASAASALHSTECATSTMAAACAEAAIASLPCSEKCARRVGHMVGQCELEPVLKAPGFNA